MGKTIKKIILGVLILFILVIGALFGKKALSRTKTTTTVEDTHKPSIKVNNDIYTFKESVEVDLKGLEEIGEIKKSYGTASKTVDQSDEHLTSNTYTEGLKVYRYSDKEILVLLDDKEIDLLVREKIEKTEVDKDPLLRATLWGQTKEDVKKIEDKQYSKMYREEDEFIIYQDVSVLNNDYLLTYLFKDNKLSGILYELNIPNTDRDTLATKFESVSDLLFKNYEQEDYTVSRSIEFAKEEKKQANHLWDKELVNGQLEMETIWKLKDYEARLKASKQSDFNFLFTKSNEILDANLYILLTPEEEIDGLMDIKPTLTKEQSSLKEGKVDIFEDSIHEDNIDKVVAQKESDIGIIRFNKSKQYVVLTNNTEDPINLTGWYMTTQNKNNTFYFEDGFIIKPKEQILVYAADGKTHYNKGISRDFMWSPLPVFDEIQDGITLYNNDNIEITKAK